MWSWSITGTAMDYRLIRKRRISGMAGLVTGLVAMLFMSVETLAQSPKTMSDPLFGITYDAQRVYFEKLSASLSTICSKLRGRYVKAWVYGHFKTPEYEYFLVSGLMEYQEDKPVGRRTIAPDEGNGLIVALHASECLADQTDYFFAQRTNPAKQATPIRASESVLDGILADAFRRYSAAFGGRSEFIMRVKFGAIGPPLVRKQFEAFLKQEQKP